MRKIIFIILLMYGCSVADNMTTELSDPKLTIKNLTTTDLLYVKYQDDYGNRYYFCPDSDMYCFTTGTSGNYGMRVSHSDGPQSVKAGTGKVYFYFTSDTSYRQYYTIANYTLTNGGNYTISLNNSTVIGW